MRKPINIASNHRLWEERGTRQRRVYSSLIPLSAHPKDKQPSQHNCIGNRILSCNATRQPVGSGRPAALRPRRIIAIRISYRYISHALFLQSRSRTLKQRNRTRHWKCAHLPGHMPSICRQRFLRAPSPVTS